MVFIIGVGANQAMICSKIRSQYPLAFIVAVADESNPRFLASALDDGANAALFSSVSPNALVSTLEAVINGKVILIDSRLWSDEIQLRTEERPSPLQNEMPQSETHRQDAEEPHGARQLSAREIAILERNSRQFQQRCRAIVQDPRADREGACEGDLPKARGEQSHPGGDLGLEQSAFRGRDAIAKKFFDVRSNPKWLSRLSIERDAGPRSSDRNRLQTFPSSRSSRPDSRLRSQNRLKIGRDNLPGVDVKIASAG
jgi:hypothetical protein